MAAAPAEGENLQGSLFLDPPTLIKARSELAGQLGNRTAEGQQGSSRYRGTDLAAGAEGDGGAAGVKCCAALQARKIINILNAPVVAGHEPAGQP